MKYCEYSENQEILYVYDENDKLVAKYWLEMQKDYDKAIESGHLISQNSSNLDYKTFDGIWVASYVDFKY